MAHSLHATLLRPATAWARLAARPRVVLPAAARASSGVASAAPPPAAATPRASSSLAAASDAPAPAPPAALAPPAAPASAHNPSPAAEATSQPKRTPRPSRSKQLVLQRAAWAQEDIAAARAIFETHPYWVWPLHFFETQRERRRQEAEAHGTETPSTRLMPEELAVLVEMGMPRARESRLSAMRLFTAMERSSENFSTKRIIEVIKHWAAHKRMPPGLHRDTRSGRITKVSKPAPVTAPGPLPEGLPADPSDTFPEHLPSFVEWRHELEPKVYGFLGRGRYFVRSRALAERIVKEMDLDGKQGITVVEAYAGVGSVTRLLLDHPAVEKVVALEDNPSMLSYLDALKTDETLSRGLPGERLHIHKGNAYRWSTYDRMLRAGALEHLHGRMAGDTTSDALDMTPTGAPDNRHHETPDWREPSPLHFLIHVPNSVHGEQLFAQLIGAVASRSWLFQFGRVKMIVLCSESLALRATAPPESKHRHKLGVTTQALTDVKQVVHPSEMMPLHSHIYPCQRSAALSGAESEGSLERDWQGLSRAHSAEYKYRRSVLVVEPKAEPLVASREMEAFEYIVRNVFVLRGKPVSQAMQHLSPGAINVLKKLHPDQPDMQDRPDEAIDPATPVWSLSVQQLVALAKAFDKWPFRPKMLLDEYSVYAERAVNMRN